MQLELRQLLQSIDELIDSYDPGPSTPDCLLGEIFAERARHRPSLEKAVAVATEALKRFPFNPELVRRRALAKSLIVTPDGEYPLLRSAEADFRLLLDLDPNNILAATELLDTLFTFSCLEDLEVAELAETLAEKAENILIDLRALQIKAFGYADQHYDAEKLYQVWSDRFPGTEVLESAIEDTRSMRPHDTED